MYIHDNEGWTGFKWDKDKVEPLVRKLRFLQGKLYGMMECKRTDAAQDIC